MPSTDTLGFISRHVPTGVLAYRRTADLERLVVAHLEPGRHTVTITVLHQDSDREVTSRRTSIPTTGGRLTPRAADQVSSELEATR